MSDDKLGLPERAALLAIMAAGGEIANPELSVRAGFTLVGKHRDRLNQLGLVNSRKLGRAFHHELTDRGWRWCAEELSAPCPPRPGSGQGALYAILAGLQRFLDRSTLSLADLFGDLPVSVDPAPVDPTPGSRDTASSAGHAAPGATGSDPAWTDSELVARIHAAYHQLAPEPGDWVSLADLRNRLEDVPRQRVDELLRQLSRDRQANLISQANQKLLTAADRQAAVRIGVEDCHQLSMGAL